MVGKRIWKQVREEVLMKKKAKILLVVAIAYMVLPDLMPGLPFDDILVALVCALAGRESKEASRPEVIDMDE